MNLGKIKSQSHLCSGFSLGPRRGFKGLASWKTGLRQPLWLRYRLPPDDDFSLVTLNPNRIQAERLAVKAERKIGCWQAQPLGHLSLGAPHLDPGYEDRGRTSVYNLINYQPEIAIGD